jgi:hypothetical protein
MHLTKGDRQTLAREAQAIAALATERGAISACPSCGTQVTDESNFCRRCGAPLELDLPELEVRSQPTLTSSNTTALPPAPDHASVTEGTTELLISTSNHRAAVPIRRQDGDTSEMDDERLM